MSSNTIPPPREPLVDANGLISSSWYRYLSGGSRTQGILSDAANLVVGTVPATLPNARSIAVATPIAKTDGGIGGNYTLSHADSTVTAATYGSATKRASFTVNAKGHLTAAAEYALTVAKAGSTATGSRTLALTDIGQCVEVGSGGSITIPGAVFANGDVVTIYNDTSGNITITCTITTAYIAGVDADKASMTLATRGLAWIRFKSGTECVVQGNVS